VAEEEAVAGVEAMAGAVGAADAVAMVVAVGEADAAHTVGAGADATGNWFFRNRANRSGHRHSRCPFHFQSRKFRRLPCDVVRRTFPGVTPRSRFVRSYSAIARASHHALPA